MVLTRRQKAEIDSETKENKEEYDESKSFKTKKTLTTSSSSFTNLLNSYNKWMDDSPFFANSLQGVLLTTFGILAAQYIMYARSSLYNTSSFKIQYKEIRLMSFIQVVYVTPILLQFYNYLNLKIKSNINKVLIDQFIFSPFYTLGLLFIRAYLMTGNTFTINYSIELLKSLIINTLPITLLSSWCFWVPMKFLIVNKVDDKYHLVVSNVVSIAWTIILTILLNK